MSLRPEARALIEDYIVARIMFEFNQTSERLLNLRYRREAVYKWWNTNLPESFYWKFDNWLNYHITTLKQKEPST